MGNVALRKFVQKYHWRRPLCQVKHGMKATSMPWTALEEERAGAARRHCESRPSTTGSLSRTATAMSPPGHLGMSRILSRSSSGSTSTCLYRLRSRARLSPVLRTRWRSDATPSYSIVHLAFLRHPNLVETIIWR